MKKILTILLIITNTCLAQNTFNCGAYITRQLPAANPGEFYTRIDSVNVAATGSSLTQKLILNQVLINAVEYYNGYIWAWKQYMNIDRSGGSGQALLKIDRAGNITSYPFTSLTQNYNAATIDNNGIYYNIQSPATGGSTFSLNRINLAAAAPVAMQSIPVTLPHNIYWPGEGAGDLIFAGSALYLYLNQRGLFKVDLDAGTSQRVFTNGADTSRIIGSLFVDAGDTTNIYGYGSDAYSGTGTNTNPQQNVMAINLYTGSVVNITTGGTQTSQSDGASCATGSLFTLTLKGKFFNDVNGNTIIDTNEKGIKGPGNNGLPCSSCPAIEQSFVALTDNSNTVLSCVPVNQDGSYLLYNIPTGQSGLKLNLSRTNYSPGTLISPYIEPQNWSGTGENNSGNNTGNGDGNADYTILLPTTPARGAIAEQNFGIEQPPLSESLSTQINRPSAGDVITLNGGTNPPVLQGSDPEDLPVKAPLTSKKIKIIAVPANAVLLYNNSTADAGQSIVNFDPSLLKIRITAASLINNAVSFQYTYIDAAGKSSITPATYTIFWQGTLAVSIKNFTAIKDAACSTVTISWTAVDEQHIQMYVVEKSTDAYNWRAIKTWPAVNSSGAENTYIVNDKITGGGIYYYRLRYIDAGGAESSYAVAKVIAACAASSYAVYPNPIKDILYIDGCSAGAYVRIYDITGKIITTRYVSGSYPSYILLGKEILPGDYIVEIIDKVNISVRKKISKL